MSYLEIAKQVIAAKQSGVLEHNAMAREALDTFFAQVLMPQLSRLDQVGKLPNLTEDPLWAQVETEWQKAASDSPVSCDVEGVKRGMIQAVKSYEQGKQQPELF